MTACDRSRAFIALLLLLIMPGSLSAQSKPDAEDFGRWADTAFGEPYAKDHAFSGMGLVMVQGDRVVLRRTYGLARRAPDQPIDPAKTRFLIGSITKTFTGLAIAQLVERGKIRSIDDPADRYLKRVHVPGAWGNKVTIRDLLTHSAGFDQRSRDVGAHSIIPTPVTAAEILRIAPSQVRAPGELVSYSNYGTGLLATMIEDLTGEPIERYFRDNIWRPLGMNSAHFQKGLTLEPSVAQSYSADAQGHYSADPLIAFHPYYWPVGAIGMTLDDAARYIHFELAAARGEDSPVLSARTHALLRSRLRSNGPDVGGFGFLMMSFDWNGHKIFGHGGTWIGYESMMLVIPDLDTAVFFSITGPGEIGNLKGVNMVLGKLLGPNRPAGQPTSLSPEQLQTYAGIYRPTMRATHQVEGFQAFLGGGDGLTVKATRGGLMIGGDGPFRPVGKDTFWLAGAQTTDSNPFGATIFSFKRDATGRVRYLVHQQGLAPFQRVGAAADPAWRAEAFAFLGYALLIGLGALGWRRYRTLDWIAVIAAIAPALAVFALPLVATKGLDAGGLALYGLAGFEGRFTALLMLGDSVLLCALISTINVISWVRGGAVSRPRWNVAHASVVAVIQWLSVGLLWSINVVGVS